MSGHKISSITDFNCFLDNEYKDLNPCKENWYPIMYYDETIDLQKKRYMTVGINPSLTVNAKKHINKKILEIKEFLLNMKDKKIKRSCGFTV